MTLRVVVLQESRWMYLFSFLAVPALLQLCVLPFLPESPRYLLMERRDTAAAEEGNAHTDKHKCVCEQRLMMSDEALIGGPGGSGVL